MTEAGNCKDCGQTAETRQCEECGKTAIVIDCGHYRQPAEIAASDIDGRAVCDDCAE